MTKGLIIGKFYPPHRGHKHLIDTAASQVDQLTVIVCGKKDETIDPKLRVSWLKKIYPNVDVKLIWYTQEELPDDDSSAWAKATLDLLGFAPDIVFTSENYGELYAQIMGSEHVLVDFGRKQFPISGTKIRNNPLDNLNFLEPFVRAHFIKRVCVVGAESSGTTTLARMLADYYETTWVPEFGRIYWEGKLHALNADKWESEEFEFIAQQQNVLEDQLAMYANKVLICDTNSWATSVWHERYMHLQSLEVEKLAEGRRYDLYLLTDIDIPFTQDGTRDGEHIREWMHNRFKELLAKNNQRFAIISGNIQERLDQAKRLIDKLLI